MIERFSYFRVLSDDTVIETAYPDIYWDRDLYRPMTRAAGQVAIADKAKAELRAMLAPVGSDRRTVFTILRRVSASGMSRDISLVTIVDGQLRNITCRVAAATGRKVVETFGQFAIREGGCGMDMGFHLVYSLGCCLWPEGTPVPHGTRNSEPDTAGGYAVKQEWL